MSKSAIRIHGLGKRYQIGAGGTPRYKSLRDSLMAITSVRSHRADSRTSTYKPASSENTFWALKDVSFDVERGEVVGIIGRNGAGKSTLLKILSRITEPTTGSAEICGRIGSLLEVGSGFHPELTGRENIYLNGAVLGMRKDEVQRKFDQIVSFAEMEQFLDTPVKRYSSGMYMRLAFSVAAHLEPDVLVVDEVLAVGDAAFQRKCLGKMQDVARQSTTVLFVSHNMPAVINLCTRAVVLDAGRIVEDGAVSTAVESYMTTIGGSSELPLLDRTDRKGNQALKFESFRLENGTGNVIPQARSGEDVQFCLSYRCAGGLRQHGVHVAIGVQGQFDQYLFHLATSTVGSDFDELPAQGEIRCLVKRFPLLPGRYTLNLFCTIQAEIADWIQGCCAFDVEGGDFFGTGRLPMAGKGSLLVDHSWVAGTPV
jgi:lipopolysaccharide transport system ATP-binding protein